MRRRTANLAVAIIVLLVSGWSSAHVHLPGGFDAARTCIVCHKADSPVAPAASPSAQDVSLRSVPELTPRPAPVHSHQSATGFRSRAPPSF